MKSTILCVVVAVASSVCRRPASAFSASSPLALAKSASTSSQPLPSGQITRCRQPTHLLSEKSNNDDLINSLLNPGATDDDPYSRYTHQIAIPLGDASELHAALHAVQTSLVRDCPRLIRACVMPALMRLPLLYVDGSSLEGGNVGGSGKGVEALLEEVVHGAIREVIYGDGTASSSDGVEPILLPFQGLELQGKDNSVLYAVGNNVNVESEKKNPLIPAEDEEDGVIVVDDWSSTTTPKGPSGWEMLEKLVHAIQHELEDKHGLATCWPLDEPQGEEIEYDDPMVAAIKEKQRKWRPRVPFVRLPKDFYSELEADLEKRGSSNVDGNGREEEEEPSRIDMGFDGISPMFWYEAWGEGEDILAPPGVRMRSVAVYKRMVPGGGEAESSFYVPTSSDGPQSWASGAGEAQKSTYCMELPAGDTKLRARERREKAKAMDRMGDEEQRAEREWEEGKARWVEEMNDPSRNANDQIATMADDDSYAQFDVGMEMGEVTVEGDAAYSSPWTERDVIESATVSDEPTAAADVVMSSPEEEQEDDDSTIAPPSLDTPPRRELPSIEDNPVFQRLWKGKSQVTAQGQNTALTLEGTPPASEDPLPPYPSDPHFVGAWRVVSSPLGTQSDSIDDAESKSSDNFILRVDGQVMGGPVLDAECQHKAAGGEWRMFQAVRRVDRSEAYGETPAAAPITQTRLRIRLLVPPEKDRALVMEGEVTRLVMPGAGDAASSSSDGWMMASGGILDGMLQNLDDVQSEPGSKGEGLLYCGGESWMEDADGGANRRKLGPFSLMKLKSIDRNSLIYTVDVSRATSSEAESADEEE